MSLERGNTHLLVLDDEKSIGFVMQTFLEDLGYSVTYFYNPLIALEKLKAELNPVDLALVDIKMPDMNGLEFASEATKLNKVNGFIFVTGYEGKLEEMSPPGFDPKPIPLIKKPFKLDVLENVIKETIFNSKNK